MRQAKAAQLERFSGPAYPSVPDAYAQPLPQPPPPPSPLTFDQLRRAYPSIPDAFGPTQQAYPDPQASPESPYGSIDHIMVLFCDSDDL